VRKPVIPTATLGRRRSLGTAVSTLLVLLAMAMLAPTAVAQLPTDTSTAPTVDTVTDTTAPTFDTATDTTTAPAVETATDTTAPAVETVTDTTAPAAETVTDTTAPALDTATDTTAPALDTATDTTAPALDTATDTAAPALETVAPTTDAVAPAVETVADTTDPTVATVTGITAQAVDTLSPVSETATDPTAPASDPAPDATVGTGVQADGTAVPEISLETKAVGLMGDNAPDSATSMMAPVRDARTSVGTRFLEDIAQWGGASLTFGYGLPWLTGSSSHATLDHARNEHPAASAPPTDEVPGQPSPPAGGTEMPAPSGGPSSAMYALLVSFGALALLLLDRLRLQPVRWRCASFVALLERPG
jgi:hypothetical protein